MVLFGGGDVWFYSGGMHGFIWGECVVSSRGGMPGFSSFFGYNEIRSMSGRYASYWNAFLFERRSCCEGQPDKAAACDRYFSN